MKTFLGTLLFGCVGLAILNLSVGIAYHEPFNFIVGVMNTITSVQIFYAYKEGF